MLDRKVQWKTVDDEIVYAAKISYDFNGEFVDLEPQRIRVFEVTISPENV